jgi:hypothetical protein
MFSWGTSSICFHGVQVQYVFMGVEVQYVFMGVQVQYDNQIIIMSHVTHVTSKK